MRPLWGGHVLAAVTQPVAERHDFGDRGVELQPLDIRPDLMDRPVEPPQVRTGTGGRRRAHDQVVQPPGEAHHALQAPVAEIPAFLPRATEQQVGPQVVGAYPVDVGVGIDHVPPALAHLRASGGEQAVQAQPGERLGEGQQAQVVQRPGDEPGVEVVAGGVLPAARVHVDGQQPTGDLRVPGLLRARVGGVAQEIPR